MNEPNRTKGAVEALVIGAAAAVAHAPALGGETTWDDQKLVFQNPLVVDADGWSRAWSVAHAKGYYAPLTTLSLWIDRRLWGASVTPYQVENLALHACSAIVFARVLRQLGLARGAAWLAAVLFAVHPVSVESVASIAERTNLLSTLLALLATSAFLHFEEAGRARWHLLSLVAGALALLARSAVVGLPMAWLLLAWWRRGTITRRDVVRVAPLIGAALALQLVTLQVDQPKIHEGPLVRLAAAGGAVWFYLGKLLLPVDLAVIYPRWEIEGAEWSLPPLLVVGLLAICYRRRDAWGRAPFAALAIFVVGLAPALGFVPMAYADRSRVADHLQYAPMLAMTALLAAWLAPYFARTSSGRGDGTLPWIGACGVVPMYLALTLQQSTMHRTEEALWTQAIEQSPRSAVALYHRGVARDAHDDDIGALDDYGAAIEADPRFDLALESRGRVLLRFGLVEAALVDLDRAVQLAPDEPTLLAARARARLALGRLDDARADVAKLDRMGAAVDPELRARLAP